MLLRRSSGCSKAMARYQCSVENLIIHPKLDTLRQILDQMTIAPHVWFAIMLNEPYNHDEYQSPHLRTVDSLVDVAPP